MLDLSECDLLKVEYVEMAADESIPLLTRIERLNDYSKAVNERCDKVVEILHQITDLCRIEKDNKFELLRLQRAVLRRQSELSPADLTYNTMHRYLSDLTLDINNQFDESEAKFQSYDRERVRWFSLARSYLDRAKDVLRVSDQLLTAFEEETL